MKTIINNTNISINNNISNNNNIYSRRFSYNNNKRIVRNLYSYPSNRSHISFLQQSTNRFTFFGIKLLLFLMIRRISFAFTMNRHFRHHHYHNGRMMLTMFQQPQHQWKMNHVTSFCTSSATKQASTSLSSWTTKTMNGQRRKPIIIVVT
jgi:hypothetical protein